MDRFGRRRRIRLLNEEKRFQRLRTNLKTLTRAEADIAFAWKPPSPCSNSLCLPPAIGPSFSASTSEQSFTANVVHVGDDLIAFGNLVPDPEKGLPYGTTVHRLLIHLGHRGPEMLEFNDQENSKPVDAIHSTELGRGHARFSFRDASGLVAGRVPLSDEEEVFEDVSPDDETQLTAICVRFEVDDIRFEALRAGLAPLLFRHSRD